MGEPKTEHLELNYRLLPASDVSKAYEIEIAEYPESEAASLENLIYRQSVAPHLFLGCYVRRGNQTQGEKPGERGEQHDAHDAQVQGQQTKNEDELLVGYIVSTQSSDKTLTHSSMSSHDAKGSTVCIHSVCVARGYQRRGIATAMMKAYLKHLKSLNEQSSSEAVDPSSSSGCLLELVLLIAHKELIGLYSKAEFKLLGQSTVEHGPDPWFEMAYWLREN
ncbi:hypothetical protein BGX34_012175 [Mortierella sp. NVP85]|nr:hypothetical protein BGX34_012175 [Mortierella sp. NVP85]